MSGKGSVPDAWDDDWEQAADKREPVTVEPAPKLSKAARKAQHVEQQKQLWDTAANPDRFLWLEAQGVVPLKQEYKPPVMLLSRKPVLQKRDPADGIGKLDLADDEDSEDERRKKREADFEDRQRKAKLEREEKQKRYAEARERIMGSSSKTTTPAANSRESSTGRDNSRRGRGKQHTGGARRSQPQTPRDQSPTRNATSESKLFDPEDMGRRLAPARAVSTPTPREDQPVRQPRGPEQSGRGGFGFANRGGKLPS